MCWVGENKPLIAEENIECRKVLIFKEDKLFSPFQNYEYKIKKLYRSKISPTFNVHFYGNCGVTIRKGLHCYSRNTVFYKKEGIIKVFNGLHFITEYFRLSNDEVVVYKCIIPKGSTYYINEKGEIVSNRLIIEDHVIVPEWINP